MKHVIKLSSHEEYESYGTSAAPVLIYDGEHLHWSAAGSGDATDDGGEKQTYNMTLSYCGTASGEKTQLDQYTYTEGDDVLLESLSYEPLEETTGTVEYAVANASTGEALPESQFTIGVFPEADNMVNIAGTMPSCDVAIDFSVKYKLTVEINNTDYGEISTYDYSYAAGATVDEIVSYLAIDNYSSEIYNADENVDVTSSSPITVTTGYKGFEHGFLFGGTMPAYNAKVSVTVSSLA